MNSNEAMRLMSCIYGFKGVIDELPGFKSAKLLAMKKKLEIAVLPLKKDVVHNLETMVGKVIVRLKDTYPGLFYSMNNIVLLTDWDSRLNKSLRTLIENVISENNNQDCYLDIDLWIDFIAYEVSQRMRVNKISKNIH